MDRGTVTDIVRNIFQTLLRASADRLLRTHPVSAALLSRVFYRSVTGACSDVHRRRFGVL